METIRYKFIDYIGKFVYFIKDRDLDQVFSHNSLCYKSFLGD